MPAGPNPINQKRGGHIRFALLLPLLSIASWVCFIAVPATTGDLPLHDSHTHSHYSWLDHTGEKIPHAALWFNGIDMPANFVELPIDRVLPAWPDTWYPAGFTVFSWRAVTFPFYALPFWWFAGVGLDALFRNRHPRWPVLLLGSVLWIAFALLAVASGSTSERPFDAPGVHLPIVVGGFLWAFLFTSFPATWLLRRRVANKIA